MTAQAHDVEALYRAAASISKIAMSVLRLALIIVLIWIGGLKFVKYEADSIVPLVSNSPAMSFFYRHPAPEYHAYMNKEGELNQAHRQWHGTNGTYRFSFGLGMVIIFIAFLIATHPILPSGSYGRKPSAGPDGVHNAVVLGDHS